MKLQLFFSRKPQKLCLRVAET